MADEDNEIGLPQKGLNMIIKDTLPDVRIANETRDLINQCCVEFVHHVAKEAQRISSDDQRKTIYHEHVQKGKWIMETKKTKNSVEIFNVLKKMMTLSLQFMLLRNDNVVKRFYNFEKMDNTSKAIIRA